MIRHIDRVLHCELPVNPSVPLFFDSPHSGSDYPDDFNFSCPFHMLRQAEDSYVNELIGGLPSLNIGTLAALFPRSYIDVNRAGDDIDSLLLNAPWPGHSQNSIKSQAGIGLVRRLCRTNVPMYEKPLSPADVQHRINSYYTPYYTILQQELDKLHDKFGAVYYMDCHSMPSLEMLLGRSRKDEPDFVLGDRDSSTIDPDITQFLKQELRALGYKVAINHPYKGVELVKRHGQPHKGRHALQIEINRKLYMDENSLERHGGFLTLRENLEKSAISLSNYLLQEKGHANRAAE